MRTFNSLHPQILCFCGIKAQGIGTRGLARIGNDRMVQIKICFPIQGSLQQIFAGVAGFPGNDDLGNRALLSKVDIQPLVVFSRFGFRIKIAALFVIAFGII